LVYFNWEKSGVIISFLLIKPHRGSNNCRILISDTVIWKTFVSENNKRYSSDRYSLQKMIRKGQRILLFYVSNPLVGAPVSVVIEQMMLITMVLADEELET